MQPKNTSLLLTLSTTCLVTKEALKTLAQQNAVRSYGLLRPGVVPVLFGDDWVRDTLAHLQSDIDVVELFEVTASGLPTIRGFFNYMMRPARRVDTQFYGYANGDILFDCTLVATLTGVSAAISKGILKPKVFIVGRRTNYNLTQKDTVVDPASLQRVVDKAMKQGKLFGGWAEDYFIVTKGAIDWIEIPPFVVGRRAYDNWLVNHAYHKSNVDLVEATNTIHAVHQTTADGNRAGHFKRVDKEWNVEHTRSSLWDHGGTYFAPYLTRFRSPTEMNDVEVIRRPPAR